MPNPVEEWKSEGHPLDVWSRVEQYAEAKTAMSNIETPDLERMKWHGFFYRKRDKPGRYMNRIRVTGCELSAEQAKAISMIAYEFGHGIVDVTTRANLQVQGLSIEHLPKAAERLEEVGMTSKQTGHDNIRNVFGHAFSGILPVELIDTRQLCKDVDAIYLGSREFSDLPRKLNICFNGTEDHAAHFWTQDLSFLATKNDQGEVVFNLLLAGTQGQNPMLAWYLPVYITPDQVVPVTIAIIELFREKGSREKRNRARLRYLVEEIGIGGVLEWLEQKLPFRLAPCIREPIPSSSHEELVGWFRQRDPNLWTMGLSVPLGRLTWQQLEGLALLSKKWGDGQLRTTCEQGIAVINIPAGFKGAAATDAAALGLSVHADEFELNTVACTGSQFCNIAVTETKGLMFQLIERLRKRALKLHGIRIHMSGCPSSCAQHFTADIGLKGVRVRRMIGTREGFDVYLGGGLSGQVHMGLLYKLGVDVDQLPNLIEEVTSEFYLKHKAGQTFSAYWREKLQSIEASKVEDEEYQLPLWICEGCEYEHSGEDPPVFCPSCAGLRRLFARVEADEAGNEISVNKIDTAPPLRTDGFSFAANLDDVPESEGLTVTIGGVEYALFRHEGGVTCIDSACPHEGASLADGELKDGIVSCPWHQWTFNVCSGCSLDPPGNDLRAYETTIEEGQVFVKVEKSASGDDSSIDRSLAATHAIPVKKPPRPVEAVLTVSKIIDETHDVKTFRLADPEGTIPFDLPGKFAKVCLPVDGEEIWRSFTISSAPTTNGHLDLTIKRNPSGQLTNSLFETIKPESSLKLKGAQGGFFFDPDQHPEPLVLISAGSGITPMMSISRFLKENGSDRPVLFMHGARTDADIIFYDECRILAKDCAWFRYFVTLSQPSESWSGATGRLSIPQLHSLLDNRIDCRYFLCGPNQFMEEFQAELINEGIPKERIHTEQFHKSSLAAMV